MNDFKLPDGWKLVRLGELSKIVSGSTPNTSISKYWENGNIVWITPDDLSKTKGLFIWSSSRKITFEGLKHCSAKIIPIDSVIISSRAPIGYVKVSKISFATNQGCKSICYNGKFNPIFLASILSTKTDDLLNFSSGTTFQEITKVNLERIIIPLPPLSEQQKIAEILETVDNCIEKTQQLIEKYKRIKQGLMEELLTKGIDENGNIRSEKTHRFKDSPLGRIPEEWEVVRLGEVFNIQAAGDISKLNYSEFKDDKYKYPIFSNSLDNKGLYGYSDSYKYPENCITITGRGTLGIAVPRFDKFNAIIRIIILIPKIYLDIIFVTEYINKKVKFVIESTGVPQLTAPKVYNYEIPLPPLPEQQRIAEILSQIDAVIEKEEKYKEKLERLKRGLMEDLLSGKIRVNHLIEENK